MIFACHVVLSAFLLIEDKPWYFEWDLWVSVFTLLLVAVTTWLVLETRIMRKGSDKTMAEMATYAAAAARAAEKSADAPRERWQRRGNARGFRSSPSTFLAISRRRTFFFCV